MDMIFFYSMALLLFFLLAQNIKNTAVVFGLWLIFCGIVGNQLVVVTNNGRMSVFVEDVSHENRIALQNSTRHQEGGDQTRFKLLADIIDIERLERIVSIGDILMTMAVVLPCIGYIMRLRRHKGRFFEKNLPISYPIALCALMTSIAIAILQYYRVKP